MESGREFSSVEQLIATISRMQIVFQKIFNLPGDNHPFLAAVFQPICHRLLIGGDDGLNDLPLSFLVDRVDDLNYKLGTMLNSGQADSDSWLRPTVVTNLIAVAEKAIPRDVTPTLLRWHERQKSPVSILVANPSPKRTKRKTDRSGEGKVALTKSPKIKVADAAPTAAVSKAGKDNICHAALLHFLKINATSCSREKVNQCVYNHKIAGRQKAELLLAAQGLNRDKDAAVAAINGM